jgi:hypothetical protein
MEAVMSVTAPEWLSKHDGELRPSKDGQTYLVFFAGQMQYVLALVPAEGKFACRVTQTINGRRLDSGASYATPDEALRGGLEDLRKALGW